MTRSARPLLHPCDEIVQTMERIYRYRMTTTSGGNLSIRDETDDVWITPARIDKGSLRREDVVCLHSDGRVEGLHRPSSEHPFHQSIYRVRPDIRAIVHAHPVALVAFSICRRVPDTTLFPQARHVCGAVGLAPYAQPGSQQLGEHIAAVFARGHDCVLLENHGVVVGGPVCKKPSSASRRSSSPRKPSSRPACSARRATCPKSSFGSLSGRAPCCPKSNWDRQRLLKSLCARKYASSCAAAAGSA